MLLKVLVFAMLSTASGWGLPNDSLLLSNESTSITGVDDARDGRQLAHRGCYCDKGCDSGCDSGWPSRSCDGSCDRNCDGRRLAAGGCSISK